MTPNNPTPDAMVLVPLYYMRDNHTFRRLSDNPTVALAEVMEEFDAGWSCGMLCTKRPGEAGTLHVHGHGPGRKFEFEADAAAWLERQRMLAAPPATLGSAISRSAGEGVTLPPLPKPFDTVQRSGIWNGRPREGEDDVFDAAQMHAYARATLAPLLAENERLRVQLAGCGVAAMGNTRESLERNRLSPDTYGYSASYGDCLRAAEREIAEREAKEAALTENERLRADQKQGGIDYCRLMDRHDAHFVRAEAAEREARELREVRDGQLRTIQALMLGCEDMGGTTPVLRKLGNLEADAREQRDKNIALRGRLDALANYYDSINAGTCADYIRTALATPSGAPDSGEALDARRYRFLRDHCKREWVSDMPRDKGAPSLDIDFEAEGHDLDAAVDAAIAASAEGEGS
jgi:hypothetical protein